MIILAQLIIVVDSPHVLIVEHQGLRAFHVGSAAICEPPLYHTSSKRLGVCRHHQNNPVVKPECSYDLASLDNFLVTPKEISMLYSFVCL